MPKKIQHTRQSMGLFEKNRGLAFRTAQLAYKRWSVQFKRLAMDIKDVEQEALLALDRAARTYNPDKKTKFSTHAINLMRNKLLDFIRSANKKSRRQQQPPVSLSRLVMRPEAREEQWFAMFQAFEPLSSQIPDKRPQIPERPDIRKALVTIIKSLPESERNKRIIIDYFGLTGKPKSTRDIGREQKMTKERVRQIIQRLLIKLRARPEIKQFL